jgi:hypothetical protein
MILSTLGCFSRNAAICLALSIALSILTARVFEPLKAKYESNGDAPDPIAKQAGVN